MNVRSEKAEKYSQWFLVRHRRRPRASKIISLSRKVNVLVHYEFPVISFPGFRKWEKLLCLNTQTEKIFLCAKSWNTHHFKPVKFPQWNLSFDCDDECVVVGNSLSSSSQVSHNWKNFFITFFPRQRIESYKNLLRKFN